MQTTTERPAEVLAGPERVLSLTVADHKRTPAGVLMLLTIELPARPMMPSLRRWIEVHPEGNDAALLEAAAIRAAELCRRRFLMRLAVFSARAEMHTRASAFLEALATLERQAATPLPDLPADQPPPVTQQLSLGLPDPPRPTY